MKKIFLLKLLFIFLILFSVSNANSNTIKSGQIIENIAIAKYYDSNLNRNITKKSNTLSIKIGEVFDMVINPSEISLKKYKGEKIKFSHEIINTGNQNSNLSLKLELDNDNEFDVLNLIGYVDLNKNEYFDESDILIEDFKNINFNISDVISVIIEGVIPNKIPENSFFNLKLIADMEEHNVTVYSKDSIQILNEPKLNISAYSNKINVSQNEIVDINYNIKNSSHADAIPLTVLLDGLSSQFIVVESIIPANTKFESIVKGDESKIGYKYADFQENQFVTTPIPNKNIISVAFFYDEIKENESFNGLYKVKINDNASKEIQASYNSKYFSNNIDLNNEESNIIKLLLPEIKPSLNNYNSNFEDVKNILRTGESLNIKANASICNVNSDKIEEYKVIINSNISKDFDNTLYLKETDINTGIFELKDIKTKSFPSTVVEHNNGIMELAQKDTLTINLICGEQNLSEQILIDPIGVVFDSISNSPIENAKVTLMGVYENGETYVPKVYDLDLNEISNIQYTKEDGIYWFPLIPVGKYFLSVEQTEDYSFPSIVPKEELDNLRHIDVNSSYGNYFNVEEDSGIITIDIPLDPKSDNNLMIQKTANKDVVNIGEIIEYTVVVKNNSDMPMDNIILDDLMPIGFKIINSDLNYQEKDKKIQFNINRINGNSDFEFQYSALVSQSALHGDGINSIQARSSIFLSNVSTHKSEVINNKAFTNPLILGKIFKDCNANGIQDNNEYGIPSVKLYLDNGYYAITDRNGNYKFFNLKAKTYSLRIDKGTLPVPYKMNINSNRNANDPLSLFVDLKYGEMHRADFTDISCEDESIQDVENRKHMFESIKTEVEKSSDIELNLDGNNINNNLISESDNGIINDSKENLMKIYSSSNNNKDDNYKEKIIFEENYIDIEFKNIETTKDLKKILKDNSYIENSLGFIDLNDGDYLKQNKVSIRIKGNTKGNISLLVNDKLIENTKIGQSIKDKSKDIYMAEYISVELNSGDNIVEAVMMDNFGNIRDRSSIILNTSGEPYSIKMESLKGNEFVADPTKVNLIKIKVFDEKGFRVSGEYILNLKHEKGFFDIEDIDHTKDGIQTKIIDGEKTLIFHPPENSGKDIFEFSVNNVYSKEKVYFTTFLRDLFATGVVEGFFDFSNNNIKDNIYKIGTEDDFDNLSLGEGQGRVSLFLKGKVKGNYLLTLSYDSEKEQNDKIFEDIEPEEFYPIYGDSSINGFEAQSTNKLFVKIEKNNSFVLFGDLNTREYIDNNISLSSFNRSLNGFRHKIENKNYSLSYYLANDNYDFKTVELKSNGGFGGYIFSNEEVVNFSEKVTILLRDNSTRKVLEEKTLRRFFDYEINNLTNEIIFKEIIPSYDNELNEYSIFVSYESITNKEKYLTYGVNASLDINENITLSATHNSSKENDEDFKITGINLNYNVGNFNTNLELSQSLNNNTDGFASKFELQYKTNEALIEFDAKTMDENFKNNHSTINNVEKEITLKTKNRISKGLNLRNHLIFIDDNTNDKTNQSIKSTLEKNITSGLRFEGGIKYNKTDYSDITKDSIMQTTKVIWQPEFYKPINAIIEYEQDINISNINRVELGIEHSISKNGKIYLRNERLSNLNNNFELSEEAIKINKITSGVNYKLSDNTDIYSEYRIDDVINDKEAEAILGVRNKIEINDKWKGNFSIERIQRIEGENNSGTSISTSFQENISSENKRVYRFQFRNTESGNFYSGSYGYIRKINQNFSILFKDTLAYYDESEKIQNRMFAGLAYRDNDANNLNVLLKFENNINIDDDFNEISNQLTIQANKKIHKDFIISGMYSFKNINNSNYKVDYNANWLSTKLSYDLNDSFDIGIVNSILWDNENSKTFVNGVEIGYLMDKNMWLSIGYNYEGLKTENKFSKESFNSEGFYIRYRLKLTEEYFEWLQ